MHTIARIVVVLVLAVRGWGMSDIWVDGDSGSDSNSGATSLLPRLTPPNSLSNNDVLHLKGTIRSATTPTGAATRGAAAYSYKADNVTVLPWPGQPSYSWEFRGDVQLVQTGWVADGNGWALTIDTGLNFSNVVYDYDNSVDSDGRHYGFCLSSTLAAVQGAVGATKRYNYNSVTGVLTVYLGGDDPNSSGKVVAYMAMEGVASAGVKGLQITGTGTTIHGGACTLYANSGVVQTDAIALINCQNGLVSGMRFRDCGYHAVMFYNNAGTVANTGNVTTDSEFWGQHSAGTQVVHYADSALGDITCGRVRRCTFWPYRYRATASATLGGVAANTGYAGFSHTDVGTKVADIQYEDCTFNETTGDRPAGWAEPQSAMVPDPASPWYASSHAFRCVRCTFNNLSDLRTSDNVGYDLCVVKIPRGSSGRDPVDGAGIVSIGTARAGCFGTFNSCVFIIDGTHAGNFRNLFGHVQNTQQQYYLNCSIYGLSSGASLGLVCFHFSSTDQTFHARGNLIVMSGGPTQFLFAGDGAGSAGQHDFIDNQYLGVTAGCWSQLAAFDTQAEFLDPSTGIDTSGAVLASDPYTLYSSDSTLALGTTSAAWTLRRSTSAVVPFKGLNGPYTRFFGAYQYGVYTANRRQRRVTRTPRAIRA